MKIKNLVLVPVLTLSLGACTYSIQGKDMMMKDRDMMKKEKDMKTEEKGMKKSVQKMKKVKKCYYAPLWFPPMDEDFLNVEKIAKDNKIMNVSYAKTKIYPYVLFTRYCTLVKGK